MKRERYEVVIAGAGMVGACTARALAEQDLHIALVEPVPPELDLPQADYDLRVSAISPRSRAILERFDAWQRLDTSRVCDYEQMFVWHQHGPASLSLDAVELARDNLGAIVENRQLLCALHGSCEPYANIEWLMPDSIAQIAANRVDGVELCLASGRGIEAGLLIAADGRHSPTRQLAAIEAYTRAYGQTALVANVSTEQSHGHTAWQRFLSSGPVAFLPLNNGQSSIVWSCDDQLADELKKLDDNAFCEALGAAFEYRLGAVTQTSKRLHYPLSWHQCDPWLEGRVLLIGDAAHGVHPLAGQGVNLGFSDVDLLARRIAAAGTKITQPVLRRYARQRNSETWVATQSFSALKWVYGSEQRDIARLRDLGMRAIEGTPWIKRGLIQKAINNLT